MWKISTNELVQAYKKAKALNLDSRFIQLLEKELEKRCVYVYRGK
jgi:16S rRNA A1518/A1519 N6-dimethyltransferase RsmA/KsgA/DIM1 with predicted DNA glycosylase/AP lyase activity